MWENQRLEWILKICIWVEYKNPFNTKAMNGIEFIKQLINRVKIQNLFAQQINRVKIFQLNYGNTKLSDVRMYK